MKSPRRTFIKTMGASATGITIGATAGSTASCASPVAKKEGNDGQILFIGDNIALADTPHGKVKGYQLIVWLHGGGFVNGNGIEQGGYNGENLTRRGSQKGIAGCIGRLEYPKCLECLKYLKYLQD
jgi:hypothetical protein